MPKTSRKIAAILAADVVGYSRLMGADDERTLAALKALRLTFDRLVGEHDGQVFGSVGDSLMAQFASAVNAVRCARSIQRAVAESGESTPVDERLALRIGVNLGDVLEEDGALFGDGVNVAARLQSLAEPGGILLSSAVYEQVRNRLDGRFTHVGTRIVKNLAEPVRVYALTERDAAGFARRVLALLRRQGVVAAVVYVGAAWTLLALFTRFTAAARVPAWMRPTLLTILAIGFVATIALTWRFDPRRPIAPWVRWFALGAAAVAAVAITGSAWLDYSRLTTAGRMTRPIPAAQPVVAVGEFRNLTGDPRLDWMGEGIANLVRDRLAESRHLVVVSPTRWQSVLRAGDTPGTAPADVLVRAERAGIGYVLSGALLRDPEGLFLTARLSDVEHGVDLQAYGSGKSRDAAVLLRQATPLAMMIKRALNVPHTESVAVLAADFPSENMLAYEAYVSGIGSVLQFDYRSAEHSFRTALQLEPNFHMARYRLALVQVASGDTEGALTSLEEIPADAELTPRQRWYIDGARALFARDAGGAMKIYSAALEQYPFDTEARFLLAQAHDVANENEAAIDELKRLLQQEPENEFVWSSLAETYLRIGRYDLARDALSQYLKLQPRDPFGLTKLGQLDQLTGDPGGAAGHFRDALELRPDFLPARLALAQTDVVRGNWPEADRALNAVVEDAGAPVISRIDAAFDLSGLRRARGQFAASIEPLVRLEKQIRDESIREARALAERSLAEAELGRFEAARTLADRAIERSPGASTRYLFALGMILLMERAIEEAQAMAASTRAQELPADEAWAREDADRAAAYLEGMVALAAGRTDEAVTTLRKVDSMPGYQYAVYKLGLARALLEQGSLADALEQARAASTQRDPGDLRLDLELDRSRALLVESQILQAMGERQAAAGLARAFLERWSLADPAAGDRALAQRLAGRGDTAEGGR